MQTTYAGTNKGYVTTLNDLISQITNFAATTTASVRTQFGAAAATFNSSSDATTSLVGSLLSRYNDLRTSRQTAQATAIELVNAAVATAEGVNNAASSDATDYITTAESAASQRSASVAAANKVLTDAVDDTNDAIAQGTTANTAAAKTITELADQIKNKLTTKIPGITAATKTLEASVIAMLAHLDDSFFSLENSVQRMRTIINADFSAFNESSVGSSCPVYSSLCTAAAVWHHDVRTFSMMAVLQFVPDLVDAGDWFAWCSDSLGDTIVTGGKTRALELMLRKKLI